MNIINLPPVLPGELDLEVSNRCLRSGEATLNWSQVKDAPEEHLAILLAGLDLVKHIEILGIETVRDSLVCRHDAGYAHADGGCAFAGTEPAFGGV
jgi:hypothetical protein